MVASLDLDVRGARADDDEASVSRSDFDLTKPRLGLAQCDVAGDSPFAGSA
jgi:hypothetical protein